MIRLNRCLALLAAMMGVASTSMAADSVFHYKSLSALPGGDNSSNVSVHIDEFEIDANKKAVSDGGVGVYYEIRKGALNCFESDVFNFCLPSGYDGKRASWDSDGVLYENKGAFSRSIYADKVYYKIVLSNKDGSPRKSNPLILFYSVDDGLLGFVNAYTSEARRSLKPFWLEGRRGLIIGTE